MAEGGVEDMAKAYQAATEKMCELCLDEDSFKQATLYCKQCRQRLCDKCQKYHRKVASSKDHQVVRAEEMPPVIPQSTEELSDELGTPMCTTHNLPIKLYCEDHNQSVCSSCKPVDHRTCKHLRDLEHVATENKGKSNEMLQYLKSIEIGLGKIEEAIKNESQSMEKQEELVIQNIKYKVQEIEKLGNKKISQVKRMFKKEQKNLLQENYDIKQTQLLVSKSIEDIETATQTGSNEEIFLATRQAEKEAEKYQDTLNDTSYVTHREADFEGDSRLTGIASVGTINLKKCKVDVDLKPRSTVYVNTKSDVRIFWADVFPGDNVTALHAEDYPQPNRNMSIYSRSTGLLSQLDMPFGAKSAYKLNDKQIVVAITHRGLLLMVDIANNKLITKECIQIDIIPWLILKYSEQTMLVLVRHADDKFCFQILDLRGNVQTDIKIKESLNTPCSMKMSNVRDIIYITDTTNGCYGFNLQGDTLFHYTQPHAIQYDGLAVDHHDCVYIAIEDHEGTHLAKLSPAGQRIRRIDGNYGFPLKYDNYKLYLMGWNVLFEWGILYIYA